MAEVKWIKLLTGIFDDEKIQLIESMPDGDMLLIIWFKLLTLAGKCNMGGLLIISEQIACTDEMLATIFRRPLATVRLALSVFEQFGMIAVENETLRVANWNKHQSVDKLERIREQNRLRQQAYRERKKALPEAPSDTKQPEQIEFDDTTETMDVPTLKAQTIPYTEIVDMYHAICPDMPHIRAITESRKKTIAARYKEYGMDGLKELFEKASESDFLSGRTGDWTAGFDWLMKPTNAVKVIEGNYANRVSARGTLLAMSDEEQAAVSAAF